MKVKIIHMQLNDAAFVRIIAKSARVARLSTVDIENMPHTVPLIFAFMVTAITYHWIGKENTAGRKIKKS